MSAFDTNNDSSLSWDEFWVAWNMDDDDDHDDMTTMTTTTSTTTKTSTLPSKKPLKAT